MNTTVVPAFPDLKTLQEATLYFAYTENCIAYMVGQRWPDGVVLCPLCGSKDVTYLPTRQLFQCKGKHPKRQFSVKVGTVFADSPIHLGKWLLVMWMLSTAGTGSLLTKLPARLVSRRNLHGSCCTAYGLPWMTAWANSPAQ